MINDYQLFGLLNTAARGMGVVTVVRHPVVFLTSDIA